MEDELIKKANDIFETLGLKNLKDYAEIMKVSPQAISQNKTIKPSKHQKKIRYIGGYKFYKTK